MDMVLYQELFVRMLIGVLVFFVAPFVIVYVGIFLLWCTEALCVYFGRVVDVLFDNLDFGFLDRKK